MAVIIIVLVGIFALNKKKKESDKMERRASSLRREFNAIKQETSEDNWIERRLEEDDDFIYELQNR